MKHSTLFFLFFFGFATFSTAQTTSGTVAVGADFPRFFTGLSRSGMKLNAGIFFADNFLFGINSGIRHRTLKNLAGREASGPALDFGLFARYYIPDAGSNLRVFLHGEGGLDRTWADDLKEQFEFAGIGGGVAYFISPELTFEAHIVLRANNRNEDLNFTWPKWGMGIKYFIGN